MKSKKKTPLTAIYNETPEGISVYCAELDLYTDGKDMGEAKEKLFSLTYEYYHVLRKNEKKLDPIMKSHFDYYKTVLLPALPKECIGCIANPFESPSILRILWAPLKYWFQERFGKGRKWPELSSIVKFSPS